MVAIKLEGRLGNQLFQYAFVYCIAKKLNTSFYLDKSYQEFVLPRYFMVKNDLAYPFDRWIFSINGFKNIFSIHLKRAFYAGLNRVCNVKANLTFAPGMHPELIIEKASNKHMYEGFFQSPLFFENTTDEIRSMFTVKKLHVDIFRKNYASIYANQEVVCVHIRRTDYLGLDHLQLGGGDLTLPVNYYNEAISRIENKNAHFVFIGDDKDYILNNFEHILNKTIANDAEIIDLQHLLNAKYCIIANSTFSWWGAWLNNNPGKKIYAPKYFLGWRVEHEFPAEIYPADWTQINF